MKKLKLPALFFGISMMFWTPVMRESKHGQDSVDVLIT